MIFLAVAGVVGIRPCVAVLRRYAERVVSKLYRVIVEIEMICYADSEEEATGVARDNFREADGEMDRATYSATAVSSVEKKDLQVLPWGSDDDRTCAEILADTRSET